MDPDLDVMRRPARLVRIVIVLAALSCLGLTMCVRSDRKAPSTPAPQNQQSTQPAAPPSRATQAKPERKPEYFPATKAAGPLYR